MCVSKKLSHGVNYFPVSRVNPYSDYRKHQLHNGTIFLTPVYRKEITQRNNFLLHAFLAEKKQLQFFLHVFAPKRVTQLDNFFVHAFIAQ